MNGSSQSESILSDVSRPNFFVICSDSFLLVSIFRKRSKFVCMTTFWLVKFFESSLNYLCMMRPSLNYYESVSRPNCFMEPLLYFFLNLKEFFFFEEVFLGETLILKNNPVLATRIFLFLGSSFYNVLTLDSYFKVTQIDPLNLKKFLN